MRGVDEGSLVRCLTDLEQRYLAHGKQKWPPPWRAGVCGWQDRPRKNRRIAARSAHALRGLADSLGDSFLASTGWTSPDQTVHWEVRECIFILLYANIHRFALISSRANNQH